MSLQNDTSTFEPWSTQDPAPRLSANPPCLTQSRRRFKMILQEKQNGQPREELTSQLEKQTFGSNLPSLPPVTCSNTCSKWTVMPRVHPMTSSLDATQQKSSNLIFSAVKMYPRFKSSKKLKLIASLLASGHVCTFNKYTFTLNSLLMKRQKKNSLRKDASAKHSIKQQIFTNAYLLICHHKKRRNSSTYWTNIDSFSKAPLDSHPPNLSTLKSNPMPSLSMDVHSLFQKPIKAWYAMKSNAFAASMSFAGATKANGLYLLSELPRKKGQIWFVSDFCQLNKWIICWPYPISIHELFKCFEGFTYCTALDLNMGFWTILLDKPLQRLCTMILPWG